MKSEVETLEAEVLDSIQPFTGTPVANNVADQVILSGGAMQQTKTAYTTAVAVQQPRSIAKIANNVLEEARLAGKSFYYRWTVKNKDGSKSIVQGASIDLAMALCRHYGNCVVDVDASETATHYMMKGIFIDLESGFTCPRLFRQRKGQGIGMKDKDRQEDIVFQIGQSKAIRNAVIKAMPEWLIERAIEVATEAELNKAKKENPYLARQKVIEFFGQYGVTPDRIEAERKRPIDQWTPDDIVDLRGMASALKERRIGPEELFPPVVQPLQTSPSISPAQAETPTKSNPQNQSPETGEEARTPAPTLVQEQNVQAETSYTADQLKILRNLDVAINDFPNEYREALKKLKLKPGKHDSDEASKIMAMINQIIDSSF
jgi:cell division septation protein DedD